jgi:PAS domain S-box-containing protein
MVSSKSIASSLIRQVILLLCLVPATVAANNEIETITLQLKWQHQFQFAGYYAALEKGFYRDAGLEVKIQPFGSDMKSPIDQVLSGAAQYGVMDSSLVKFRLHGEPVVALAVIFQKSPLAWLVRQDSGIRDPHDLVGKRAMYHTGTQSELFAMLQVEGIPVSKINLIPSSFDVQDLIDGHTDAYDAYTTNEPYFLREQGIAYRLITARNYGIDFYTDVLFTSAAEIDQHPERAKAFRLASLKGWEYAMAHPDEIIDLISNKYGSKKSRPHLEFEAEAMRKFIMPDLITIGHMNSGRWRVIAERLVTLGLAEANYNLLEGFIYDPSPKPQDLTQFYVIIASVTLLALLFLSLALWIGRLNTRLKKSEQRIQERNLKLETLNDKLNQAQEVTHIGSYVWDLGADRTTWTDELYRITGYSPSSFEPGYERYIDCIHPDDRDEFTAQKQKVLREMGTYRSAYRIIRPEGEIRYIHEQGEVKLDAKGEVIGLFGIIQDITERKLAEKEKEDLQRELQQVQKMDALGKLTGGIAHDYNNMLGVITGYAELLKDALDKQPRLARYAHQIHHAGERSAKLTKKLLAFSRTKTPEANCLNLNMLLLKQQHMLEKTLTVRIKLVLNLEKNPWFIWLDESDMEDAILNMSINAMHAIEGIGQLTIQTSNQKINQMDAQALGITTGDYVLLSVTDTGCGIDKESIERIFDPFYSTKGELGSGLGLSQVYGFVQRSGGVIKVDSEPGQGTQFTLYFPRYHESGDAEQSAEDYPAATFTGNKTILVVDDEPALLNLTGEMLGLNSFNVICAESAKQALNILQHESVDVLVSDIIMPDMDGYQLAAIVKEKYPSIKIQLASGFSDERNMDKIDESLRQNLLLKPYNSQALLQRIRELLNEK